MTPEILRKDQKNMTDSELIELCDKSLSKMCETGGHSFTMCVPPRLDDTDMLFSELIRRYEALLKANNLVKSK